MTFDQIFIDRQSVESALAIRISTLFPPEKIRIVEQRPWSDGKLSPAEFDRSKRNLYITPFRGQFFKRCPGAKPGLSCCNYFVLNLGLQCDMNCSYCYLQSYINSPVLTMYSNIDQAICELNDLRHELDGKNLRIGTGEVIDSLSLDPLTLYSRDLIAFFRTTPQWTLEFKTKSDRVDQFLDCDHAGNILVSWSVNPEAIVAAEEHGTASLAARLKAARKCRQHGFPIAFHLDPMIWHPDWKANYAELVDQITEQFTPDDVRVLSLGALRFQPEQRSMMRERFGMKSWVLQSEMFKSGDGKMRYAQEVRSEMFDFVLQRFARHSRQWKIFLCMETPETWIATHQQTAHRMEGLAPLFERIVVPSTKGPKMPIEETPPHSR
jgi:spore photoproduct lyase